MSGSSHWTESGSPLLATGKSTCRNVFFLLLLLAVRWYHQFRNPVLSLFLTLSTLNQSTGWAGGNVSGWFKLSLLWFLHEWLCWSKVGWADKSSWETGAWCTARADLAFFTPLLAGCQVGFAGWWWYQSMLAGDKCPFDWRPGEHRCVKVSFPYAYTIWLLLTMQIFFPHRCQLWHWPAQQEGVYRLRAQCWHPVGNPQEDWKECFLPRGEVCTVALPAVRS